MRHRKSGRKLNRNSSHRKALMKNLAIAFIERELIKTTLPKAKELRGFVEPLITLAKVDSVANRRRAFSKLRLDSIVNKLFTEIAVKSKDRPGDKADVAYVEWVDRDIEAVVEAAPELKDSAA